MIDLVAQIEQVSNSDAARMLSDFLCITHDTPVPSVCPVISPELKYEAGRLAALELWHSGEICPPTHPYLRKKDVTADLGIRVHPETGNILIPLRDENDELWSLQRISPDGSEKKITFNGKLTGNFYVIGGERDTVFICEGYATAMTVAIATGKTSVMAVSAGNLAAVGAKISKMYPAARLVFAADNDQDKELNPGVKAANAAVAHVGRGTVIAPPFPAGQKGDWNDYALIHGAKAVKSLLVTKVKQLFVDVNDMQNLEPEFLIDGVMETPCTAMVFGGSGTGKSFFVIDMALHVASGQKWLNKTTQSGPVFYICGEGRHGIPRRKKAWEKHHGYQVPSGRFMVSQLRMSFEPEEMMEMVHCIDSWADNVGKPKMIIIDTMARALPGNADENSAKDTNLFFNECDRLQSLYNCAVVVVHHSGHGDSKRARGSSAIKGVLDVEIMLNGGMIEWTKTKDMEPHAPIRFSLDKVSYGEGKRENSCVVMYDLSVVKEKRETASQSAAKSSLIEAIRNDKISTDRCTFNTWRDAFYSRYPGISERGQRKAFKIVLNSMFDDGSVVKDCDFIVISSATLKEHITNALMFNKF
ncbi:MAG: AAA family ATPase [Desulfuromonadales bacterium]